MNRYSLCKVALALAMLAPAALLAATGTLSGEIVESKNGLPLASAKVTVGDNGKFALTNVKGEYTVNDVPTGKTTVTVTYLGYKDLTEDVTIEADKTTTFNATLEADVRDIGGMTVVGRREGQTKALNQRKNAPNVVDVVASDLMGKFPDTNPAEALGRMPGVALDRDGGEGRMVKIRGGESRFATATLNGVNIPGAETHTRTSQLDVIGNNTFDQVELHKVLTPDMDMDAITGNINMVAKQAAKEKTVNVTIGSGYHNGAGKKDWSAFQTTYFKNKGNPNVGIGFDGFALDGAVTAGARLAKDRFGFLLNLSANNYNQGYNFGYYAWDDDESTIATFGQPMPTEVRTYDYAIFRSRYTAHAAADFKFNPDNLLYGSATFSQFNDFEWYKQARLRSINPVSLTQFDDAAFRRYSKDRLEYQQNIILNLLGEHKSLNDILDFDWMVAYSEANETEPNRLDSRWDYEGGDLEGDWDPKGEFIDITRIVDTDNGLVDPHLAYDQFEFNSLDTDNDSTFDKDITAGANLAYPVSFGGGKLTLKGGVKGRFKTKWVKDSLQTWDWIGPGTPALDEVVGGYSSAELESYDWGNRGDYNYLGGEGPDQPQVRDFFHDGQYKGYFEDDGSYEEQSFDNNYIGHEYTGAGYLMGTLEMGKITGIIGARYEGTQWDYKAKMLNYDAAGNYTGWRTTYKEGDYGYFLPALLVKYALVDNANLRFGLTRSYSRAEYNLLKPSDVTDREEQTISRGNPDLSPTTSWNVDLLGEYFFGRNLGLVSGGFFYKALSDLQYTHTRTETIDGNPYSVTQPINADNGYILGLELGYSQQMSFLPGALSGLGLHLNYTFTKSSMEVQNADDTGTRDVQIEDQAPHVANLSLSYDKYGLFARLALHLQAENISSVGETEQEDRWYGGQTRLDLNLAYRLGNFEIYADLVNLLNDPESEYYKIGGEEYIRYMEYYSWWSKFGVTYNF